MEQNRWSKQEIIDSYLPVNNEEQRVVVMTSYGR
jgi:hypothetical protein